MFELNNGLRVPSPSNLMLILTQDCQLRCSYCFEEHRHNEIMSFDVAKRAIDFLWECTRKDHRIPSISLFGGEPMLMWDELIVPIIDYIRNNFAYFKINMTTNGLLLNNERLNYLRTNNVTCMLSIDGAENGQNATRRYLNGKGTFSDLESIIDLILQYTPTTPFRMTVTPDNVQYLYESVEWFQQKGIYQLRAFPNIYCDWSDEALHILDEQLKKYNQYLYYHFTNDGMPLVFDIYEYYFKKILIKQYEIDNNLHRSAYFCQTCNKCGIGLLGNFMCNYQGDLFTCDRYMIRDLNNPCFVGNIFDGIDIDRINKLYEMCDKTLYNPNLDCKSCKLDNICSGGCIPVNFQITGDFSQVPDSYCKYNCIIYDNVVSLLNKFENEKSSNNFKEYFQNIVRTERLYVG